MNGGAPGPTRCDGDALTNTSGSEAIRRFITRRSRNHSRQRSVEVEVSVRSNTP